MGRIFRVSIQIEELIENEFKRIINSEETTHIDGLKEVLADKYNITIKFLDKSPEDKNASKNPLTQ